MVCTTDVSVIAGTLYKMGTNEILCLYVPEFERTSMLAKAHGGVVRGNYEG